MKAKAPERIWIDPATDFPKLSGHIDKDSVEYTRTDAFIEKAKMWMLTHTYMFQSMEEVDLYIEMFIKEMKGE